MASTKRKVSLTLDEELVKALEGDDGLSAQVNNALAGLNGAARRRVRQAMVDRRWSPPCGSSAMLSCQR